MLRAESSFRGRIDWGILIATVGLVLIGGVAILSAASLLMHYPQILQRHFLAVVLGTGAFLFGMSFHYQIFQDQSRTLYGLTIIMMILVLVAGETIRGHRAWLRLPYFAFQPSELAKISTVLILANYLDRRSKQIESVSTVLGATGIVISIVGLILLEPDYSSAVIFFPILISMLFCAGANLGQIFAMSACGAVTVTLTLLWTLAGLRPHLGEGSKILAYLISLSHSNPIVIITVLAIFALAFLAYRASIMMRFRVPGLYFIVAACVLSIGLYGAVMINSHIKYYQRNRFLAFLAPEADPQEAGYNVNQALVAIGSGGLKGKGIFSGTQSQLGFLPERQTDFIFAVIGEEMGLIGSLLVLGLYLLLLGRIIHVGIQARDRYGLLVCSGFAAMFGFYTLVNVGMCVGLLPVAGIPLPLVSYGGSSLVVSLWAIGIVMNIYSKRYAFI